jgi:hypothetical protein
MELESLLVYKLETGYKERVGNQEGDGGYVIIKDIGNYDVLVSAGIADDISFEESFLKENNIECFAFDGTINVFPKTDNLNIKFINKNIDSNNNLHEYLEKYKDIFLKMDIEGHEFEWIKNLKDEHIQNIKQLVIEFHLYTGNHWEYENQVFYNSLLKKLRKHLGLVHLHVNNCLGCRNVEGQDFPMVFECTFIRKDLIKNFELSKEPIPSIYDRKNTNNSEIYLKGYPYN